MNLAYRLTWLLAWLLFVQPTEAAQIKIVLRYDDYSKFSNSQIEESLFAGIESLGGGLLVGVIPFPYATYPDPGSTAPPLRADLDDGKIRLLARYASKGTVEVAVHGYNHGNNATGGQSSEFTGLPEDRQRLLLKVAKGALEQSLGFGINSFVPPFNAYDDRTLKAMESDGYKVLSAAGNGAVLQRGGLAYLPGTTYAQRLKAVIAQALGKGQEDAIVTVVIHGYDIEGANQEMPDFRGVAPKVSLQQLMEDLRSIRQSPDVRFVSIRDLVNGGEDLSANRLHANQVIRTNFITSGRLLPDFLDLDAIDGLYYTEEGARSLHLRQIAAFVVFYAALLTLTSLAVSATIGHFRVRRWAIPVTAGAVAAAAAAGIFALASKSLFSGFYMSSAIGISYCAGVLCSVAIDRRRARTRG